jgi:hypothetical protein
MSISLIASDQLASGLVQNLSSPAMSITAQTGDIIDLTLQYRQVPGSNFVPSWNGIAMLEVGPKVSNAGMYFQRFYLKVPASATATITAPNTTYAELSRSWKLWRSSTNTFANPPIKTVWSNDTVPVATTSVASLVYGSGSYTTPTITNTLDADDVVSFVLATSDWNTSFGTGTATFLEDTPSVFIGEVDNTNTTSIKYLRSGYTTGVGSVTTSLTKAGSHNPMYQFSTIVLTEGTVFITSINNGSPISPGLTNIPVVTTGFVAKPTAMVIAYENNTKFITGTIGAGTANNFVFSLQERIEGEDWPLEGTILQITFIYGSDSTMLASSLTKKSTESVVTFTNPILDDPEYFGKHLADAGLTVEGGELVYDSNGGLVVDADTGGNIANSGAYVAWFRPATGLGAGNVYRLDFTIALGGVSTISIDLSFLGHNSTSPYYDGAYPLGNRS